MTIHLDTSALVGALAGPRAAFDRLRTLVDESHRVRLSTIALYEWLRGPRTVSELRAQEELFPRGRDLDLAVAACALVHEAALWTLNPGDFSDVPGLKLL